MASKRLRDLGRSALWANYQRVITAKEGRRNQALYRAAADLGRFVCQNAMKEKEVIAYLTDAAQKAGLSDREIAATIASALTRVDACWRKQ